MQIMLDMNAGPVKAPDDRTCSSCGKDESALPDGAKLKSCARCRNAFYCNAACQQAHWKDISGQMVGTLQMSARPVNHKHNCPFAALRNDLYLKTMPTEQKVYEALIDAHRLRRDDEYKFDGDACGLYGGDRPWPDFEEFLDQAEGSSQLPTWWSKEKREACEAYAARKGHGFQLDSAVEKSDIIENYKDPLMPMKLRMLAEKVIGRPLQGGL